MISHRRVKMAGPTGDHARVLASGRWKEAVQAYLAAISYLDAQVGRVLDAFDRSAYSTNTIICFWGDHGWHLGEKSHWRKFALWEEATRAPFIGSCPASPSPAASASGRSTSCPSIPRLFPGGDFCAQACRGRKHPLAPREPVSPVGQTSHHHVRPEQSRHSHRTLALHPLSRTAARNSTTTARIRTNGRISRPGPRRSVPF
jgi:hypothetical protein